MVSRSTGKNIVICCDGTGNEFTEEPKARTSNSNVVRLYATLYVDNGQTAYYHPGVGTIGDPTARTPVGKNWSMICGLAFARGFKANVMDAYRYLMETYNDGDCVYLIGFSRGAYTVRALAGLLDGYGLLCRGNEGHMDYAWNSYVRQHKNRKQNKAKTNRRFKETFSRRKFRVHFLGIWDTVSSVGWAYTPLRLFSIAQNPTVRHGRHAISIDERRCFYRNNVWEPATPKQLESVASEDDPKPQQDLLQVWFPGVHSDVGGSYPQESSGLANHSLEWLLDEAVTAGLRVKAHMRQLVLGQPFIGPMPGPDEERRVGALRPLFVEPRSAKVHRSLRMWWWMLELLPHRYDDKDSGGDNWRIPFGTPRRIPAGEIRMYTGESYREWPLIHASAVEMMRKGKYRPKNVRHGLRSLRPLDVHGQSPGTLYLYEPGDDPRPFWDRFAVRWSVMLTVSAAELAATGLVLWGAWLVVLSVIHLARGG